MVFGGRRGRPLAGGSVAHPMDVRAQTSPVATAEQSRRTLAHLDYLVRTLEAHAADWPAAVYQVIGSYAQIARGMKPSLLHLGRWLESQRARGGLVAEEGPFVGDAVAAVEVTSQALSDAARACNDLYAALERAHMATAHLAAPERVAPNDVAAGSLQDCADILDRMDN